MATENATPPPTPKQVGRSTEINCPKCRNAITVTESGGRMEENCPVCHANHKLFVFPRLFREPADNLDSSPELSMPGDATCHFYPELKAELVCDECGCFMSKKASIDWGEKNLCMPCLHSLREQKQDLDFQATTKVYDNRALALVTWMAPFTLFTAPLALFILIRHRKASLGFIPRSKYRWWVAMILAILWIIAWITALVAWIALIVRGINS